MVNLGAPVPYIIIQVSKWAQIFSYPWSPEARVNLIVIKFIFLSNNFCLPVFFLLVLVSEFENIKGEALGCAGEAFANFVMHQQKVLRDKRAKIRTGGKKSR